MKEYIGEISASAVKSLTMASRIVEADRLSAYIDSKIGGFLPLSGGGMTGNLSVTNASVSISCADTLNGININGLDLKQVIISALNGMDAVQKSAVVSAITGGVGSTMRATYEDKSGYAEFTVFKTKEEVF